MSQNKLIWLVAYTLPKAEKKANEKLQEMGIPTFLPLYEKLQVWSDRKKRVLFPLFPNYIFIQTTLPKRYEALKLKEVVRYISFGNEVAQVRDDEIEIIRKAANSKTGEIIILNSNFQEKGQPVRIIKGPLAGLKGVVEHSRGKDRLLIRVNSLKQTISLEVSADMLAKDTLPDLIATENTYPTKTAKYY